MKNGAKVVDELTNLGKNLGTAGSDIETSDKNIDMIVSPEIKGEPIEIYTNDAETDTLTAMNNVALECAKNAEADGIALAVSPVTEICDGQVRWFYISSGNNGKEYAVYQIGAEVYYRPVKEFKQIVQNIKDGVPGTSLNSLKCDYRNTREPIDSCSVIERDDCLFIVQSIVSSMTGRNYDNASVVNGRVNENIKIRKHNKLGTDGISAKSKMFHDAKYGTSDENAFKQEIEDKQKKDGTVGALDQQQEESVQTWTPKLPNIHNMSDMNESVKAILEARENEIVYEPLDRVLVKLGQQWVKGTVTDVDDDVTEGQIVTVMVQGHTITAIPKELKPDTDYLLHTRWGNCDNTGEYEAFDLDPKTRLNNKVENDKKDYSKEYKDLNDYRVECDVVVDGFKLNYQKYYASLAEISESCKTLHLLAESGDEVEFESGDVLFSVEDWPWAVVVEDGEGTGDESEEPLRKIRINPTSYINAEDDDMVECTVNGEPTEMIKKNIKIIS